MRLVAAVVKALKLVTEKQKKVREATINSIIQCDSDEFTKVSNKPTDELIADMEKDIYSYATKAKLCIEAHDEDIKKAEKGGYRHPESTREADRGFHLVQL